MVTDVIGRRLEAQHIMERRSFLTMMVRFVVLLAMVMLSSASLSPSGINYEVVALTTIKNELNDPYNVLENWDINSVDPCSWRMVTCSADGYVSVLGLPSQSFSGTLSPAIGNLTSLQSVLLQNNAISGPIPNNIGKLEKLQTLDLSSNQFSGSIPSSLGNLRNLNYLRLNKNILSGPCPDSLSNIDGLTLLDLSYNNLSGSLPKISARTFNIVGNPLICGLSPVNNCSNVSLGPVSYPPDDLKVAAQPGVVRRRRVAIALGASVVSLVLMVFVVGLFLLWHRRQNQQIFFDVNGEEASSREEAGCNGGQGSKEQLRLGRVGGDGSGGPSVHAVPPRLPPQDVRSRPDVRRGWSCREVGGLAAAEAYRLANVLPPVLFFRATTSTPDVFRLCRGFVTRSNRAFRPQMTKHGTNSVQLYILG